MASKRTPDQIGMRAVLIKRIYWFFSHEVDFTEDKLEGAKALCFEEVFLDRYLGNFIDDLAEWADESCAWMSHDGSGKRMNPAVPRRKFIALARAAVKEVKEAYMALARQQMYLNDDSCG